MAKNSLESELDNYDKKYGHRGALGNGALARAYIGSKLTCGAKMLRYVVMGLNAFFLIVGFIVIIVGAVALQVNVVDLVGKEFLIAVVFFGCFMFVLSLFGAFGAYFEKQIIVGVYVFIIGCMFLIFLIGCSWAISKRNDTDELVTSAWNNVNNEAKKSVQDHYECCGLTEYGVNAGLPCPSNSTGTATGPCLDILVDAFNSSYQGFAIFGLILAFILLFNLVLGILLIRGFNQRDAGLVSDRAQTRSEFP